MIINPRRVILWRLFGAATIGSLLLFPAKSLPQTNHQPRPIIRDFMGLNVHTVQFRPDVYKPVCWLLRDYHPFEWDVGDDTSFAPQFPFARNRVDWKGLYGTLANKGI